MYNYVCVCVGVCVCVLVNVCEISERAFLPKQFRQSMFFLVKFRNGRNYYCDDEMPMQAQCIARDIVQNIFIVVRTWFCVCAVAKGGKDRNENVVKRGKTCVLAPVGIFSLLFIFFC